jgi:translocator protein
MTFSAIVSLAGFLVLCLAIGGVSGYATMGGIKVWYKTIRKPSFNPPNWLFGPVWTVLYIMMAVSAWLVWQTGGNISFALGLFTLQLALNFAWSFIFFRAQNIGWALVDILALWLTIAATVAVFSGISSLAAWLLLPYLAWVSFASLLNASIWRLN